MRVGIHSRFIVSFYFSSDPFSQVLGSLVSFEFILNYELKLKSRKIIVLECDFYFLVFFYIKSLNKYSSVNLDLIYFTSALYLRN